jgi:nucleoside-diphosphate-sugar epimerase
VVNCAGLTAGSPDELAAANVTGTSALATAMIMAGLPARLVHLGSAAEYGSAEPGTAVTESAPPRSVSSYGVTKLTGTRLAAAVRADVRNYRSWYGVTSVFLDRAASGPAELGYYRALAGFIRRVDPGGKSG